jgi:hypothetical protein
VLLLTICAVLPLLLLPLLLQAAEAAVMALSGGPGKSKCGVLLLTPAALCRAAAALQAAEAAVMALSVGPGELKTETVEEFISISDGQVRAATQ